MLPALVKAEKWFHVKQDLDYSFLWIMRCLDGLAAIEVLTQGEITGREVIQQALPYNPEFFRAVYTDLIHGKKTPEVIQAALQRIHGYMRERVGEGRSASRLSKALSRRIWVRVAPKSSCKSWAIRERSCSRAR